MKEEILSVQDILEKAGKYGCLALVYSFFAEKVYEPDFDPTVFASKVKLIIDILDAQNSGLLDNDFFVKDANKLLKYLCPEAQWTVTKQDITSMKELRGTVGAVRFDNGEHSHWVAYADGKIIFDTLTKSYCRARGKPTTARIINIKENK